MSKKVEIKPGQVWCDKRNHSRMVRVTWYGESWDSAPTEAQKEQR